MDDLKEGKNGWRTSPLYTINEVAHLARVSSITVKRWLYGYETETRMVPPMLGEQEKKPQVSFLELVETVVASKLRRDKVTPERIRLAHEFAKREWGMDYPFAHLKLESLGGHILHRFDQEVPGASLATLDSKLQQWTLPSLVIEAIHTFDYEVELASRWYPIGKTVPIVVDPRISAGLPVVLGRGVTVDAIYKRFTTAKEPIKFIAQDFGINRSVVEEVIRYRELIVA